LPQHEEHEEHGFPLGQHLELEREIVYVEKQRAERRKPTTEDDGQNEDKNEATGDPEQDLDRDSRNTP